MRTVSLTNVNNEGMLLVEHSNSTVEKTVHIRESFSISKGGSHHDGSFSFASYHDKKNMWESCFLMKVVLLHER